MGALPTPQTLIEKEELVELCAEDMGLYGSTFFPNTFRQRSPQFHYEMDDLLEDSAHQHVAFEAFRGSAKTSKLRVYSTKRIAYGISRTIMLVGASQMHAKTSLQWLRTHVEHNKAWTSTYGLSAGEPWSNEHICINHNALGHRVHVIAAGITGQVRGVNLDDWRPDLILADDPCDEESVGTPEQREKSNDLLFGAIQNSLSPVSESPQAKMVMLATSLDKDDPINLCHRTAGWATRRYPCFDRNGDSAWPERWTTEELRERKQQYIDRNQLLTWLREMECTTGARETAFFRQEWLQYWETLPERMLITMGIDPVPPPSDVAMRKGTHDNDYEVISVVGFQGGNTFLLDYTFSRGHDPEWTITEFFRLMDKWRPLRVRVEGIAYQRTLKWILEKAMQHRRRYVQINATNDKRKKRHRIQNAFAGIASNKRFFIHRSHQDFITQFASYPTIDHEDILDSVAMAIDEGLDMNVDVIEGDFGDDILELPPQGEWRVSP